MPKDLVSCSSLDDGLPQLDDLGEILAEIAKSGQARSALHLACEALHRCWLRLQGVGLPYLQIRKMLGPKLVLLVLDDAKTQGGPLQHPTTPPPPSLECLNHTVEGTGVPFVFNW